MVIVVLVVTKLQPLTTSKLSKEILLQQNRHGTTTTTAAVAIKVFYQGANSEADLPICSPRSVCNKVDTYDTPWVERQCKCPHKKQCSTDLTPGDGHTVTDKTRQFKLCEPISELPKCRFFRDITWTFINYPDNSTQQIMHCLCPKSSVAYIIKRQMYESPNGLGYGYQYSFACSPQSRLRCQRKEPCRLFTVKKRQQVEEVNTNTLCQCPHGHRCPHHHTDVGVIPSKLFSEEQVRTYSGYCD